MDLEQESNGITQQNLKFITLHSQFLLRFSLDSSFIQVIYLTHCPLFVLETFIFCDSEHFNTM